MFYKWGVKELFFIGIGNLFICVEFLKVWGRKKNFLYLGVRVMDLGVGLLGRI